MITAHMEGSAKKRLYLIGGAMGIGKTTVGKLLNHRLENSVFLDGDWCWYADPFTVTEETKGMVMDNICHLLNNFLACSAYQNVVFCWVMHRQEIIDEIVARLNLKNCELRIVSLVSSETALRARLETDVAAGLRSADVIERSLARLPLYRELQTVQIDVSDLTPEETAERIVRT